ncbi:hypothetical protein [Paenibacillus albiflavus]|nr:hypothetical protein [Paenibacillus albiflavus]
MKEEAKGQILLVVAGIIAASFILNIGTEEQPEITVEESTSSPLR